jgi:hypothetical protein
MISPGASCLFDLVSAYGARPRRCVLCRYDMRSAVVVCVVCAVAFGGCAEDTQALDPPDASDRDASALADAGVELCNGRPCAAAERCNAWTRTCQSSDLPYPPPGQDNGGECTTEAECRSSGSAVPGRPLCVTENGADYCVSYCSLPDDFGAADSFARSDCPEGSVCFATSQFAGEETMGTCVRACREDTECRTADGYYCRRTFGERTYTNGYCAPAHCRSRGCIGYACSC